MKKHLNGVKPEFNQEEFSAGIDNQTFLIARHLVPGQLVIYPLFNLHSKNDLIFRFPGHKKRLLHYATGHIKRLEQSKKKVFKHAIHKDLFPFIDAFIDFVQEFSSSDMQSAEKIFWHNDAGRATQDLLSNFSEASDILGVMSKTAIYNHIKEFLAKISVRPAYGYDDNIVIWGTQEARLQQTDIVIMAPAVC